MTLNDLPNTLLTGKRGLILGIADEHSIAYGCAQVMHAMGAELATTYFNDKAELVVRPLAQALNSPLILPCNVEHPGELEAVFEAIRARWGRLDFAVHSIAYAPKDDLHGRLTDCSRDGFLRAMDVSCHSFVRMARLAEPLMTEGGCLATMSYAGAYRVVEHYGVIGPVKAALEAAVGYLAAELGPQGIRVHAISPGPLKTRAASGIADFDAIVARAVDEAPQHRLVTTTDVGLVVAMLVSDYARALTGNVAYVDASHHVVA